MPVYCSPTALQRLFHHQGERAVQLRRRSTARCSAYPRLARLVWRSYARPTTHRKFINSIFLRTASLNRAMMKRAKEAGVEVMMLTVDTITGGNRERDLRTGFSIPFKLTLGGMFHSRSSRCGGINYVTHERFKLPQLDEHVDMSGGAVSISRFFSEMLDPFNELG